MWMIEKMEECPNGCAVEHWAYDAQRCRCCGWDNLVPGPSGHDFDKVTQDARLQNDREWRAKVEWQKQRAKELIQQHNERLIQLEAALLQARREFGAFLTLSGETLLQMDAALTPTRAREFVAEIEGELIIWESEGGFAPSAIQIAHLQLESWLAEKLDIPVTKRGNTEQGRYGKIVLKLERPKC